MKFELEKHLPADFHDNSRVWIYQSNRLFQIPELLEIEGFLKTFVADWNSHGIPVKGFANMFFGRFLILMADETQTGVSGCSTDSSVHMVKELEKKYNCSFFDRQLLSFYIKETVELIPLSQLEYAYTHIHITDETLFFDNTVATKKLFMEQWPRPLKETWLAKRLASIVST